MLADGLCLTLCVVACCLCVAVVLELAFCLDIGIIAKLNNILPICVLKYLLVFCWSWLILFGCLVFCLCLCVFRLFVSLC